jgi:hypothetical protein
VTKRAYVLVSNPDPSEVGVILVEVLDDQGPFTAVKPLHVAWGKSPQLPPAFTYAANAVYDTFETAARQLTKVTRRHVENRMRNLRYEIAPVNKGPRYLSWTQVFINEWERKLPTEIPMETAHEDP